MIFIRLERTSWGRVCPGQRVRIVFHVGTGLKDVIAERKRTDDLASTDLEPFVQRTIGRDQVDPAYFLHVDQRSLDLGMHAHAPLGRENAHGFTSSFETMS